MANYTSTEDLIADVLFRGAEPTDGTSDFDAKVLEWINKVYQGLWEGGGEFAPDVSEDWWWIRKDPPGVLIIEPKIETGTVAVTNNSASATLSANQAKDLDNFFFKVDDHEDVFRISAHTGGAAVLTLDSVYTGDTDAAAAYKLFKLEYDLASDVLEVIGPMRTYRDNYKIEGLPDIKELDLRFPLVRTEGGIPTHFAAIAEQKVRFSHLGGTDGDTDLMRVEYDYDQEASDLTDSPSSIPLVPRQYRTILADGALFHLHEAKNDNRANGVGGQATAGIEAMQRGHIRRMASQRAVGRIFPRRNAKRKATGPLRTESGLIIG